MIKIDLPIGYFVYKGNVYALKDDIKFWLDENEINDYSIGVFYIIFHYKRDAAIFKMNIDRWDYLRPKFTILKHRAQTRTLQATWTYNP